MKCISLWQPWATLMAIGAKRNETRSWETMYRGPLAIHASKKWDGELEDLCYTEPFRTALRQPMPTQVFNRSDATEALLPKGCIVAVVTLDRCVRITDTNAPPPTSNEYAFGDYAAGRFAWVTSNLRRLDTPIPFKGAQGLFNVPIELFPPNPSPSNTGESKK